MVRPCQTPVARIVSATTTVDAPFVAGGPSGLPLDAYEPNLIAAHSLNRLVSSYAGPALRVRRSSDDAEADIGYAADGTLDTVALLAHCGAGDGYVTKWYDQSGNARNLVRPNAPEQPRIVSAGAVEVDDVGPAVHFLGSPTSLEWPLAVRALVQPSASPWSCMTSMMTDNTSESGSALWLTNYRVGDGWALQDGWSDQTAGLVCWPGSAAAPGATRNARHLITARSYTASSRDISVDAGTPVADNTPATDNGHTTVFLGGQHDGFLECFVANAIFFNMALAGGDVTALHAAL